MPKIVLQFEGRLLKDYDVGGRLSIGRLPDNTVVIDNPAVSGHHACIYRDGEDFVVQDLESTNGTYVNQQHVLRRILHHGDVIGIGKHRLVFEHTADALAGFTPEASHPTLATVGKTMFLETSEHRELLAELRHERWAEFNRRADELAAEIAVNAPPSKAGVLCVLAGQSDRAEYQLQARTSVIGKCDGALVRLHGWFKPQVAIAIARAGEEYVATAVDGRTFVNGQPLSGRYQLKHGDVLQVSGLTVEFQLKG